VATTPQFREGFITFSYVPGAERDPQWMTGFVRKLEGYLRRHEQRLTALEDRVQTLEARLTGRLPVFTVTNATTDRAYNATATTVGELANVLATLLSDLHGLGL
jgi:hypothetical protein